MEPKELSMALLQPQLTVVAILGELLATLPREGETLLVSAVSLYRDVVTFTKELRTTLYGTDSAWRSHNVTSAGHGPVISLSRALAAYKSTPGTTWKCVTWAASRWQWAVAGPVNSWVWLAGKAAELRNACREAVTEAADMAATARARELQDAAARDGTAQESMGELGQALGGQEGAEVVAGQEAQVGGEAMEAASEATVVRQRLEMALGLLERLVAACDEATAFPRELQRRVGDIEAALKETNAVSPDVPEDLVAKVAEAERLWEANARLVKDHLLETLPDIVKFYFDGAPASSSACGVAERCQRAMEDIPRLLRPPERPQGVCTVSPMSMEPQELSPALLQPQVAVVATLGELLATVRRWDEEMMLLESAVSLCQDLEDLTRKLWVTLYCTEGTWWRCSVTFDDDDGGSVTSLSQALAAYRSTPGATRSRAAAAAGRWQSSAHALLDRWAELAGRAVRLRSTCRCWARGAAAKAATATARARELQDAAARDGTAQEHMGELGLGREEGAEVVAGQESQVREQARVAASEATRATMVRQRLEMALGLLERLVAACDEATAFPRELQWRLRDTETALEGTNAASPDVPEELVAKVAVAERLWEASARLAKDHLRGTVQDIIGFYFTGAPAGPRASAAAERCQRATEDIARLLRAPERPQGVLKMSPASTELREVSPALLQPQVTVVATLAELLATLPRRDEMKLASAVELHWDLVNLTKELRVTLYCTGDTWWRRNVTSDGDGPATSLSQALSTPGTPQDRVTVAASEWQGSVAALVSGWARLARAATKLHNSCIEVAAEAVDRAVSATAEASCAPRRAPLSGPPQENLGELGRAQGGEHGAEEEDACRAQRREQARVAAREATRATMVRQRLEAALGLLERLVAACDEATALPRELQRRVGDIKAALKGTNWASPDVPEELVAKVAEAERLWEASARLAKGHLWGTFNDTIQSLFTGGRASPRAREVAERCQRAMEDIPRLLRPPERPQSVPEVSPVGTEPQELSPALLQPQVTMVAILVELLDTLPREEEEETLLESPRCLYRDLQGLAEEFHDAVCDTDDTWYHRNHCSFTEPLTALSRALAAYRSTPWSTWLHVRAAASEWHEAVAVLADRWAWLPRKATELRNACREAVTEAANTAATARARALQEDTARDGTAQEHLGELGQALGGQDGAEAVAGQEAQGSGEAMEATSEATVVRQRLEASLVLLERLVAACDEATVFTRELQRRVGDIEAALKGTNEASPDVPEDLVAKVALAERLWEANTHLAHDHLEETLDYIVKFYIGDELDGEPDGEPASPSACEVAERCQRATEDIPRLLQLSECPQGVPEVPPVTMELQEVSPALLQPQVTVVATLGELLATLPRRDEETLMLPVPAASLYWGLVDFTESLWVTLYCTEGTWWRRSVTCDDGDALTPLSGALAAYDRTPWTSWDDLTVAASKWQRAASALAHSWARLARTATELRNACRDLATEAIDRAATATKLCNTCRDLATEAIDRAATATARARELQDAAARDGAAQEHTGELGLALGGEDGAKVVAGQEAQVRGQAREAVSEATVVRQRLEMALGLLERLVAACDEATALPRELQRRIGDIRAALKWTNEGFFGVLEDWVARAAEAERLWEASARLAKGHLLGAVPDAIEFLFTGGPTSPRACGAAERGQRATEDIPGLLRPQECPQSVPEVSPEGAELQEVSPPQLLKALVSVVATLGEVVATVTGPHRGVRRRVPPKSLHGALRRFTRSLRETLDLRSVPSLGDPGVPSLGDPGVPSLGDPGVPSLGHRGVPSLGDPGVPSLGDPGVPSLGHRGVPSLGDPGVPSLGDPGVPSLGHRGVPSLGDPGVPSPGDPGVPSLGRALAALGATPGTAWADARAAGRAWRESVAALEQSWEQVAREATELRDTCEDAAPARARDKQDKATRRGTAGDNLAATAQQLVVALDRGEEASAGPTRDARVAAATKEAMVATRRARAATRRGHWAEVALGPLQRLVAACDRARLFLSELQRRLGDIEAALEGANGTSPDVPEALVAAVAQFEQLWEASACLFTCHLLGTLGDIHNLLSSPSGGRGGPGSRAVAERCQKAIEDIPRLLQISDVTAVTSSRQ